MGLYNGKNPVAQLWGCHGLHTADEYGSIQTGRANVKSTASLLYKNYHAARPV